MLVVIIDARGQDEPVNQVSASWTLIFPEHIESSLSHDVSSGEDFPSLKGKLSCPLIITCSHDHQQMRPLALIVGRRKPHESGSSYTFCQIISALVDHATPEACCMNIKADSREHHRVVHVPSTAPGTSSIRYVSIPHAHGTARAQKPNATLALVSVVTTGQEILLPGYGCRHESHEGRKFLTT